MIMCTLTNISLLLSIQVNECNTKTSIKWSSNFIYPLTLSLLYKKVLLYAQMM
jgi:hypothetical protein